MASVNMRSLVVGEQSSGYPADAYHYIMMRILIAARAHDRQAIDGPTYGSATSDVAAIRTRAARDGEDFVLNGQKMWLTNGGTANLVAVPCRTDDGNDAPHRNMGTFLIEKEPGFGENPAVPGLTVPRRSSRWGTRASTPPSCCWPTSASRPAGCSAAVPARASTR